MEEKIQLYTVYRKGTVSFMVKKLLKTILKRRGMYTNFEREICQISLLRGVVLHKSD